MTSKLIKKIIAILGIIYKNIENFNELNVINILNKTCFDGGYPIYLEII